MRPFFLSSPSKWLIVVFGLVVGGGQFEALCQSPTFCADEALGLLPSDPAAALERCQDCLSSESLPDSLRRSLSLTKLKAYYFLGQTSDAEAWADSLLDARMDFSTAQQAELRRIKGALLYRRNAFRLSIGFMLQAAELSAEEGDLANQAKAFSNLGNAYNSLSMLDSAVHYLNATLLLDLQLGDTAAVAGDYNHLSTVLFGLQRWQEADSLLECALALSPSPRTQILIYQNLATANLNINPQKAKQYIEQVIGVYTKNEDSKGLQMAFHTAANIEIVLSNFDTARVLLEKALLLSRSSGDSTGIATNLGDLGRLFNLTGKNPRRALDLSQQAYQIALNLGNDFIACNAAREIVFAHAALQNMDSCRFWLERFDALKTAIFNDKLTASLVDVETRHQVQTKQLVITEQSLQIAEQNTILARQRLYLTLGGTLLLIIALMGGIWGLNRRYRRNLFEQIQRERLHQAMFVAEQKERIRIARDLHDSLGQKLAVVKMFLHSDQENQRNQAQMLLDQTMQETRSIAHNLMPEALKLGLARALEDLTESITLTQKVQTDFSAHQELPLRLNDETALSMFRIVQEVLSNMLQHAQASRIDVRLRASGEQLQVVLQDNGKGFDTRRIEKSEGLGWKNIKTRCELLGAHFAVQSAPGKGTTVTVNLPL